MFALEAALTARAFLGATWSLDSVFGRWAVAWGHLDGLGGEGAIIGAFFLALFLVLLIACFLAVGIPTAAGAVMLSRRSWHPDPAKRPPTLSLPNLVMRLEQIPYTLVVKVARYLLLAVAQELLLASQLPLIVAMQEDNFLILVLLFILMLLVSSFVFVMSLNVFTGPWLTNQVSGQA